jgi:acetyltransferase-like isoleucine patch superfamily enzyme
MSAFREFGYQALLRTCNALLRVPGHNFRLAVVRRLAGWNIGDGTVIERGVTLSARGGVTIGSGCNLNRGAHLDGRGGLRLGDRVNISPEAMILTADHDVRSPDFAGRRRPVTIGSRVWIATRAIVLPGTTIGDGAVVAAGAVVRGEIPPNTIWAGNPARQVGDRPPDAQTQLESYRRWLQ